MKNKATRRAEALKPPPDMTKNELIAEIKKGKKDLSGADLSGANLRDADLHGADLRDADLAYANLRAANLWAANLRAADLSGADLSGANLRDANLRDADLSGANLHGANLRDADLHGADLSDADLAYAKTNNRFVQVACIGSAKRMTTYSFEEDKIWCGCFAGTLAEFEAKIEVAHKDSPQYLKEYQGVIVYIKSLKTAA